MTIRAKRRYAVAAALLLIGGVAGTAPSFRPSVSPSLYPVRQRATDAPGARQVFEHGIDRLLVSFDSLGFALKQGQADDAQQAFRRARAAYKRVESLLTFTAPLESGWLNGPPAEDEDDFPRPPGVPGGFQIVEAALFPSWNGEAIDSAVIVVDRMRRALASFRTRSARLPLHESEVLDAARLELARISTLGLAGFDTDQSGGGVLEAVEALEGMREFNAALTRPDPATDRTLAQAAAYLRAHPDFERLNRLEFFVGYAGPAARAILAARSPMPAAGRRRQRPWRLEAATVFDKNAFDLTAYASFDTPPNSAELVELGKRLFFDPRLSGPGNRSCSTCHDPGRAFADGKPRSPLLGSGFTSRNTPTLWNAAYQPVLFHDQRAPSLEAQVDSVLANTQEMASSSRLVAERLRGDSALRGAFARVLAGRPEAMLTANSVRAALAAYIRSLTALDSRFDRAVRGDTLTLTALEREGLTIFMGKGRCGTCHFLPLFNGTAPPQFLSSEGEIIGVPVRAVTSHARLDADSGRGKITRLPEHLFAFKVPTLRNVTLTAPYMHNGAYQSLEQVIDFYDRGGGAGIGADVPGQTLPDRRLNLNRTEKRALVAFLGSLVDTSGQGEQKDKAD